MAAVTDSSDFMPTLADALANIPNSINISFGAPKHKSNLDEYGGFLQDDWRVGQRLTLNLGLRWESEIPRSVEENKLSSFDPLAINPVSGTRGVVTFAGQNGVPNTAWDRDWNNFGPRLGFAWSLGHTVIRGGGGIFYASAVSNIVANVAALGFSIDSSITSPQAGIVPAFALANGYPPFTPPPPTPDAVSRPPGPNAPAPGHAIFGPAGVAIWGDDLAAFLRKYMPSR